MIPKRISVIVELGGKSVCGVGWKPESCLDCSELPNCVLDNFYEILAPIREEHRKKKEDDKKTKSSKSDLNACRFCGKETVGHIVKEGARYHVLCWDNRGTHCSEKDCEINHGYGRCVPKCEYPRNENGD